MRNKYLLTHEWKIIEDRWDPERHEGSESLFSLGNGYMGQRANFEEDYSGKHLQGSYIAGIYYPDKTRVGWWKNGYPEYFAKVLNAVNWIGIHLEVDGVRIDLNKLKVLHFRRELNMEEGHLLRTFTVEIEEGKTIEVEALRFVSMHRKEIGALRYSISPKGFSPKLKVTPYLDFDVINADSNYDEKFWEGVSENAGSQKAVISAKTKKLDFHVAASMRYELYIGEEHFTLYPEIEKKEKYAANTFELNSEDGKMYTLYKYAAITSSLNHSKDQIISIADKLASDAMRDGFQMLLAEQKKNWKNRWENCDIIIEGDPDAQQGIRFNIFQLTQTYTGEDARLNIGPKGFTGEKYGGSTYWDTEAYCLPFYMSSSGKEVARNLLVYRHNHLPKAIENAQKLGFTNGAALYPMVTMNGEECHNEWEITFEEIHRNGAIAFAIYNYSRYFGDESYIQEYGLEVLIGIARFWAQRFNWSKAKQKFVMLGVTGPNEYENNVNNNWYTNYIACWTIQYTTELIEKFTEENDAALDSILAKTNFSAEELEQWKYISEHVFLPEEEELGIFLQQEGFMDKELKHVDDLAASEKPINQHWSWDRILRSCFIKQADVLQGMYLFEDHFDPDEIERNFDFYEPMTVHESSLSPCVHVILAAYLNKMDKAYELYLRTSRLDLDDYNHEVDEGLHITSMAGTWMSVVEGFGGMRVKGDNLYFNPKLPKGWNALRFKVNYRGMRIAVSFEKDKFQIVNHSNSNINLIVKDQIYDLPASSTLENTYL